MNTIDQTAAAPATPEVCFRDLLSDSVLLESLARLNLNIPTPVQAQAIGPALKGLDLVVEAKTGSGKTLSYVLPLLQKLRADPNISHTACLIISPTRELATQICSVINSLVSDVSPVCVIGGVSQHSQVQELRKDHRIVVGTPGRLLDLIQQRELILRRCEFFVLDEADEMLSMGFLEEVRSILSRLPTKRQGMFVSATITSHVESLARSFLTNAEHISVSRAGDDMPSIEHCYYEVGSGVTDKASALCDIIETERPASAIIFCNTKSDTELVEKLLRRRGFDARRINSDLTQRAREYIMTKIRAKELSLLVGTDIAARGLDIEHIDLVVNYALPEQSEVYVHRTGRTGRAGRHGRAVSIIGPQDFTAFINLKRTVPVELKLCTLPTEDQIIEGRLEHFYQFIRSVNPSIQSRDLAISKKLLKDLASITDPSEELTEFFAKLYQLSLAQSVKVDTRSLEEEMGISAPQPERRRDPYDSDRGGSQRPRSSDGRGRDSRENGRHRSGGRGR